MMTSNFSRSDINDAHLPPKRTITANGEGKKKRHLRPRTDFEDAAAVGGRTFEIRAWNRRGLTRHRTKDQEDVHLVNRHRSPRTAFPFLGWRCRSHGRLREEVTAKNGRSFLVGSQLLFFFLSCKWQSTEIFELEIAISHNYGFFFPSFFPMQNRQFRNWN